MCRLCSRSCRSFPRNNYKKIGRALQPQISPEEVQKSIKLLLSLGLIKKKGTGYIQADAAITTGDEVNSSFVRNFHLQNFYLARESLDSISEANRDLSCLVLALSRSKFQQIKREVQKFRKAMANIADEDQNPTDIYHLSFQFFPTTHRKSK